MQVYNFDIINPSLVVYYYRHPVQTTIVLHPFMLLLLIQYSAIAIIILSSLHYFSESGESDGEEEVCEVVEGGEVVDYVYSDSEDGCGPTLPTSYEDEEDFDSLLF